MGFANAWKGSAKPDLMRSWWLAIGGAGALSTSAQGDSLAPPAHPVVLRSFDPVSLDRLRADPTFQYDRDLRRLPTLWERLKTWLSDFFSDLFGAATGNFIADYALYLLIAVVLIFCVIMLRRGALGQVFHGTPRSLGEVAVLEEDIRAMDLPAMIDAAEREGDLRRAIRLHYLMTLRKLVNDGVLKWSPDHTDLDYVRQIEEPGMRARFSRVALVFQWVWYGHGEVSMEQYKILRRPFVEFERPAVP